MNAQSTIVKGCVSNNLKLKKVISVEISEGTLGISDGVVPPVTSKLEPVLD